MKVVAVILIAAVACQAYPEEQGKATVNIGQTGDNRPVLNVAGKQEWISNDENSKFSLAGSHTRELGGRNRHDTKATAQASHQWKSDNGRAMLDLGASHNRELGGMNRHQSQAQASGSYDVFRSNDGRTRGSVFGGTDQKWNSHGSNSRGYEYGGRLEHTWGRGKK